MENLSIDLVLPETRFRFADTLIRMHQDRKRVFIDRLGWQLRSPGSWLEVDQFDNDYAIYMVVKSSGGSLHEGSVRLLPSTQPHLLKTVFSSLCRDDVPTGENCWEISRLVTNPDGAAGTTVIKVHRLLALALVEFATLNGIQYYTLVTEARRVPALLSVGWAVKPLGLPTILDGEELQAMRIDITPTTLQRMRERLRTEAPVLRTPSALGKAA